MFSYHSGKYMHGRTRGGDFWREAERGVMRG